MEYGVLEVVQMRMRIELSKMELKLAEDLGLTAEEYVSRAFAEFYSRYSRPVKSGVDNTPKGDKEEKGEENE